MLSAGRQEALLYHSEIERARHLPRQFASPLSRDFIPQPAASGGAESPTSTSYCPLPTAMPALRPKLRHAAVQLLRAEWIPLAVLFLVALAVWAFFELADEVAEGDLSTLDRTILLAFRQSGDPADPLGPPWFEEFVRDVTALGSLAVLSIVTIASAGYLWLQGKHAAVVYLLVAVLGAQLISSSLKHFYNRPRPDLFPHGARVYSASFPSGHSTMSTATYLTLGAMLARYEQKRRVRIYLVALAIMLALAVGVSRVYLGVHWPSDVIAGWTVGAAWALLCSVVAVYLQRRHILERRPAA
jgi:undecaprenyl-diphosphatase